MRALDQSGEEVLAFKESIGNASADYAEYFAVVRALQALAEKLGPDTKHLTCELRSENKLLIDHLSAQAEIKDVSLIGHFIEIYNLRVAHFPHLEPHLISAKDNQATHQQ
jgi:ribonuclease HI